MWVTTRGVGSPGANRGVAELAILVDTRCQQIEAKTDALRRDMMTEIRKVRAVGGYMLVAAGQ